MIDVDSIDEAMRQHSLDALQRFMRTASVIDAALGDAREGPGRPAGSTRP